MQRTKIFGPYEFNFDIQGSKMNKKQNYFTS